MRISLKEASDLLLKGKVVGVPTETVYGLAASLNHPTAIQDIYRLKGRPSNNPLIVHVANVKDVFSFMQEAICDIDLLARDFWPGPLTLVLPIKSKLVPTLARADLPTAAFRVPNHPLTLELLKVTGPLVMPSANLSGRPSSTTADHVETDFGPSFPVLDGGSCHRGLESTILIFHSDQWQIIRQGALAAEHFEQCLGYKPALQGIKPGDQPICPGQMYRHYAPKAKLILRDSFENIHSGTILGFEDRIYPEHCTLISLGALSNPEQLATNLYSRLRDLDNKGYAEVMVDMRFSKIGLLRTLAERLEKAASK